MPAENSVQHASKQEHTPGPWHVYRHGLGRHDIYGDGTDRFGQRDRIADFVKPEWDTFRAALLRLTLVQAVEWAAMLDDEIESVSE
jgi:hypothetical protein